MEILDYTPNQMHLKLYAGDDSPVDFFMKSNGFPIDVTGWVCRVQFRQQPMAPNIVADFTGTIVNAAGGHIRVLFPGTKTKLLVQVSSVWTGVYDVQMQDTTGSIITPIGGQVTVYKDITR